MCSVIGVLSKTGRSVSAQAHALIMALRRRGPEAFGISSPSWERKSESVKGLLPLPESTVCLAHCLLSTTGYGVQPFTLRNLSLAHNGQVYNYGELHGQASREPPDKSLLSSDSEAVTRFLACELRSKSLASALRSLSERAIGEYALGILCGKRLFAFRDFIGQKPVWFSENNEFAAFASEPLALTRIGLSFPQPLRPGYLLEATKKGFTTRKIFGMQDFRESVTKKHSMAMLKKEFEATIGMQTSGLEKAAVLFSGGVDSSLVAKTVSERVPQTRLFVAGLEGSHDIVSAKASANELGLNLEKVTLSESEAERLAVKAMGIMGFFDVMQAGIAVPELACAMRIREKGFKVAFSGQGSDEVFCGYSSYAKTLARSGYNAVEEELWSSLSGMWSRNFYRDDIILANQSLELRLPFMQRNFLAAAMAFPAREKILSAEDGLRKHSLRELARLCGVPARIVMRPKKAMQYGSGAQKIVSRILK